MKTVGIIPARMASTRFPGKPMAKILGRPMIEHVYRRAEYAKLINELYIATCDEEVAAETERFGGRVMMTSPDHSRGTDRVAEAAERIDCDIILNIQGDEPLVDPAALDGAVSAMKDNYRLQCLNLVTPIKERSFFTDPNVIKTVIDQNNKILYFSRQPIPTSAEDDLKTAYKQIGIYLFRRQFLLQFSKWEETPLEEAEKIDMLRILERGFSIEAFLTTDMISVDTPQDLSLVEQLLLNDSLYQQIFGLNQGQRR